MRPFVAAVVLVTFFSLSPGMARAQAATCDPAHVALARDYVIRGEDAARAAAAWSRTLDAGGAITWTATLYDVEARSSFVIAFDRQAIRVYRSGVLDGSFDCIDPAAPFEAAVPWSDVDEIRSGNWVLWIKFRTPVRVASDRGRQKTVRELKVNLHGQTGDLTFHYNLGWFGELHNLRGIAVGPTDYQRRIQHMLATTFDAGGRIALSQKGRGAGW
ncbi:MAG TPA: hypothetical protein VHJ77_01530 [Vicinamibacterales bacterium]|jgi:hypothetical protein|nr:hypothetical protein [Vicinamibacterales bacterium]